MNTQENLTKENFWNEMMEKYPNSTDAFCKWIDNYKKENNWEKLFNDSYHQLNKKFASNGELVSVDFDYPKFHDLPIAMQVGIWNQFMQEQYLITAKTHIEQDLKRLN